jgi:hypothetical protein
MKKQSVLTLYILLLMFSVPDATIASEGPAWLYFIMAPFALFSIPFFMTAGFVSIAAYCYWRFRNSNKKLHGIAAVLALLLAIPVAVRDKQSYITMKIDREHKEHVQLLAKQRREARRAGKHVSPDFSAMSSAAVAKYQATAKTETDRLNYQASRDMIAMSRTINAMQQKEPHPVLPDSDDDKPPVRSVKTFLFELYAVILLTATLLAGAVADRWRRRRKLNPPWHLASLFVCIYLPVLAQLPFIDMFMGVAGPRVYLSWVALLAFSPFPYIVLYLSGVLFSSWRPARVKVPQVEQQPENELEREEIQQAPLPEHQAADAVTFFACPECKLAGKIATEKLPEHGLMATCPRCKASFPVKPAYSDNRDMPDSISSATGHKATSSESSGNELKETAPPIPLLNKINCKINWKKSVAGLVILLLCNWLVQTLLLNVLIIMGSNAGAKFTLLPPQSLLPWTLPTRVSFIDKASGRPLAGKQVRVTWDYNNMGIIPETEARYADKVYTTDAQGKIQLPFRLKPYKTYLFAFYHSFNHGIFLFLSDPAYNPAGDTPYLPPRIQGERMTETIAYTPCKTPKDWEHALGTAYMHPYSYLKSAIDGIVSKTGLEAFDDHSLNDLSERCAALVTPASRQVDEEVVRRGPQRVYTETFIRTLIRLGRNDGALAALPLLAGRPFAEEWQDYFKKFSADLAFEKEIEKEAAPLVTSGKKADQLHEEGLALHKQQKQRQSLPYYQAAITLAPESSRFHNNYAVAVTDLKHDFFAEKLCRKSILYDPNRNRAYMALGRVLIYSSRNMASYLLLKESLRLGYNDSFTWSNLAIVADNLKFANEARAAVKEARKLDPNNPDLGRFRHLDK